MPRALIIAILLACPLLAETEADRWNLDDIYASNDAWREAKAKVAKDIDQIDGCRRRVTDSAGDLLECMNLYYALEKEVARVYSYASMRSDEDTQVDENAQIRSEAQLLYADFSRKTSFMRPEIIEAGRVRVLGFIDEEPKLEDYRHPLEATLNEAAHVRSQEVEEVIAQISPLAAAPQDFYRTLANAEIPWPTVTLSTGEEVTLDQAGYVRYRQAPNREDRKLVFREFWKTFKKYEKTLGVALYSQLKRDHMYAELRKYPTSLAAALSDDNIPETVYRTLVRVCNENLSTLHRYFKIRARMLGVEDPGYYDIYPPLVATGERFPKEKGVELALAAGAVLGDEYVEIMQRGFEERWIDWYPRKGKRSGAYMNGSVYDIHPFVLLNYNEEYDSVSTLAHEYGHAVHSFFANKKQPYATADYATFTAEIASTTNENILLDHMLKNTTSDEQRLFYLGHELENIRGTFFRQAMFAEFELRIHDLVDEGEALTGGRLTEIYGDLLKRYHGHDEGVMEIDDAFALEWAYIPHFYYNFYVFQYATSISAAAQFSDAILTEGAEAKQRYLDLLAAGGSDYPIELLKKAGIDMTTPAPYEALVARAEKVMDEIEAILDRKGD